MLYESHQNEHSSSVAKRVENYDPLFSFYFLANKTTKRFILDSARHNQLDDEDTKLIVTSWI
jgi:hypothetical protein